MTTTEQAPPKCSYGIVPLPEFERQYLAEPQAYLVDGLIADQSVNIVAGDSGLGKSPWAYHLGFSIATGTPFLGYAVRPGPVLYIDLENGRSGIFRLTKSLARHLGLTELPPEFYLLQTRDHLHQLEAMVRDYKPALVIIDSLRAYRPGAEQNNENAADVINDFRRIAKRYGVAFLIIHHIKKPGENGAPLEDSPAMTWLLQACGARALINQTDMRIGFDNNLGSRRAAATGKRKPKAAEDIGLVMKGFERLGGEFGPVYLARDFDDEGTPLGYRRMTGPELLFNDEQQAAFGRLPPRFTFTEAKLTYGKGDQATRDFLQKCTRVGILKHDGRLYIKLGE